MFAIRVDRELDRVVELENLDQVFFRVPDSVLDAFKKANDEHITVTRVTLYEEWKRDYDAQSVQFSRHPDGYAVMALPKHAQP